MARLLPPRLRPAAALLGAMLLAGAAPAAAGAQQAPLAGPALLAAVDSIVQTAMRDGPIPGVSVAITRGGEPVLVRGWGHADLELDVPAGERTVYRIGSVTKQFTAAAIMRLVEQGKVELDDTLSEYLQGLPAWADRVTIHQLLNHTSGIRSYTALGPRWIDVMPLDRTHEQMLALFKDEPADFGPGARFLYNNSGYYLLGLVIEKVTGQGYADHLEEQFHRPLGLESTLYCSERPLVKHRAEGYAVDDGQFVNDAPISMTQPYAAGALCSTVGDLAAWARALAHGRVVSPDSYRRMTTPTTPGDGKEVGYGYGLSMGDLAGEPYVAHGGGINGFISQLSYYPRADVAIAVLSNSGSAPSDQIERAIARKVFGIPAPVVRDLPLGAAERARYLGVYDTGGLGELPVVEEGERLRIGAPLNVTLLHQGDHTFAARGNPEMRVVFRLEGDRATSLTLTAGGSDIEARRVR